VLTIIGRPGFDVEKLEFANSGTILAEIIRYLEQGTRDGFHPGKMA